MRAMIGMVAAMSLFVAGTAQAQVGVKDLVGARAAGGEQELQTRGWVHIKTEKGDDRAWSNWWQPTLRKCITVAVVDGRFDAVTDTLPPDCNQRASKGPDGAAVAAGVGIAAIIAAAALAHGSHQHDNGQHLPEATDAQFERGYRDGLYNQPYHNYDRADAYSDGYSRGVAQRGHETSYRQDNATGAAGYAPSVNLNDLWTMQAASADAELQRRGFRTLRAYQAGDTAYTIRGNDRTAQCVQVAVADGRVRYISSVNAKACR